MSSDTDDVELESITSADDSSDDTSDTVVESSSEKSDNEDSSEGSMGQSSESEENESYTSSIYGSQVEILKGHNDDPGSLVLSGKVRSVSLKYENLSYSVMVSKPVQSKIPCAKLPCFRKKKPKFLLYDLHGSFEPGEVVAILGPSGAGKTTFMNLLAQRISGGNAYGSIKINGKTMKSSSSSWKRSSAFVMQDDIMLGNLTPKETFFFSSFLKHRRSLDAHKSSVNFLLEELGLAECKGTKIGSATQRGISGGQRKRVNIGIELIGEPSIVFIDEPTSGLDSSTAYALIITLKKLAQAGRTVITTIHQPSSDIFFLFDKIMLLSQGHMLYNGKPQDCINYFSKLGFQCPKYSNPAEFILNLAFTESYIAKDGQKRVNKLVKAYRKHIGIPALDYNKKKERFSIPPEQIRIAEQSKKDKLIQKVQSFGAGVVEKFSCGFCQKTEDDGRAKKPGFLITFFVLMIRSFLVLIREPMVTRARTAQTLFLAILIGVIYWQVGDDQVSVQNRNGSLFFVVVNQGMTSCFNVILIFAAERAVFVREKATGTYSTTSYFLSRGISDFPFQIIFPFIFATLSYWMIGYDAEPDKYFIFVAAVVLVANSAQSLGLMLSCASSNADVSMALAPMLFIPLMLFAGFLLNDDSIPVYLDWVKYLSVFKYGFQILAINEYDGLTFTCNDDERTSSGDCPIPDGETAIDNLNLDNDSIWGGFLGLLVLYFGFRLIALILLWFTAGRKKGG